MLGEPVIYHQPGVQVDLCGKSDHWNLKNNGWTKVYEAKVATADHSPVPPVDHLFLLSRQVS